MTAPLVQSTCAERHEPRPGRDRARRMRRSSGRRRRRRPRRRSRPRSPAGRAARRADRRRPACSERLVTARSPGRQSIGQGRRHSCRRSSSGSARRTRRRSPTTAATAARASAIRARLSWNWSTWPRPTSRSIGRDLGHGGGRLGGQRTDRSGVEVDARRTATGGRSRIGRVLLRIGQERGDHGRMIPTMSWAGPTGDPGHDRMAGRAAGPAGSAHPRPALAARRQQRGGPRRRAHPGRGPDRLASRPDRGGGRWRGDRPRQPRAGRRPRRTGRHLRRDDGRRLRRFPVPCSPPGPGGASARTASSRSGSSMAAIQPGSPRAARSRTPRSNAGAVRLHGARPEPHPPHDRRRPRPPRVTRRDPPGRARAVRVQGLRGQHQSDSATSRAHSTSRSGR